MIIFKGNGYDTFSGDISSNGIIKLPLIEGVIITGLTSGERRSMTSERYDPLS